MTSFVRHQANNFCYKRQGSCLGNEIKCCGYSETEILSYQETVLNEEDYLPILESCQDFCLVPVDLKRTIKFIVRFYVSPLDNFLFGCQGIDVRVNGCSFVRVT